MAEHPASNAAEYANFVPHPVRRAAERANELALAQQAAQLPAEDAGPETATVVNPVAEPPAFVPPAPAAPAAPAADWEQRYRTLQGKYDREVPALRADVARTNGQIEHLTAQIAELRVPATQMPASKVPDLDIETYGEDLVTATRRWARAEVATEMADLRREVGEIRTTATSAQRDTAQTRQEAVHEHVLKTLDADPVIGADWRTINDAPEFMAWLDQADPFTGTQRFTLLRDALARGDANRTGAFFKAYVNEQHTASRPQPTGASTPPAGTDTPALAEFASPGRASGQAPGGAPADKRIWTQRDITAFYRDRTKGAYRDREAESLRLEQDIVTAAAEGRIR